MNEQYDLARIQNAILIIRGQKVILDRDLAMLYDVETRVLNQAVRRNLNRFPSDFMFPLTREEIRNISQIVTCSEIKHAKNVFVFTEQGVAMLSSVLKSERAIQVNILIMRTRGNNPLSLKKLYLTRIFGIYKSARFIRPTEPHHFNLSSEMFDVGVPGSPLPSSPPGAQVVFLNLLVFFGCCLCLFIPDTYSRGEDNPFYYHFLNVVKK